MRITCIILCLIFSLLRANAQQLINHDLQGSWDTATVLKNPNKGWYVHYYDNGIDRYGASLKHDDLLEDFPGLHHIYLRLSWAFLEPQEGRFNWVLIDSIINKWKAKGYKITFRITCKETAADQVFATPQWVMQAGAKGAFVGHNKNWEPDYGDAIFLKKLEQFHKAFAARYDGKPFVEYIDIGSYGDWGEGHNFFGSKKDYSFEVIQKHFEIYKRCYKKTLLMISDDIITSRAAKDGVGEKLLQYIVDNNIAVRDDSISVKWFADNYGFSTLRSGFIFDEVWRRQPVDLELEHYQATLDQNTWKEGKPFEAAIHEAHATYIGFHGEPRKWLTENLAFAKHMANKVGYWYFIKTAALPQKADAGKKMKLQLAWFNKGVAPAYHRYKLLLQIKCNGIAWQQELTEADNRTWMPDSVTTEAYTITLPQHLPDGLAQAGVKLIIPKDNTTIVQLGLKWKNDEGFYKIGNFTILSGKTAAKKKLVLFGDSITESAFEDSGYAFLLARQLSASYQLIGAGIGGNRITDLAGRVDNDVLVHKPDAVLLFVGVNDCGWHQWHPEDSQVSVARYEKELESLVEKLKAKNIRVLLCTPALIGEKKKGTNSLDASLNVYAAVCKKVAQKTGATFVNLREVCQNYLEQNNTANAHQGILTTDGVHLSATGSALVANTILQAIH